MSREEFQRIALVTLVVLLAALASDRLMAMMRPSCTDDHTRIARVHVSSLAFDADEARRLGEEARRMGEEARRVAEEHRRIAEEHRHLTRDRCDIEWEFERNVARDVRSEFESIVVVR